MFFLKVFIFSCVVLCVSCRPSHYYSDESDEYPPWYGPASYPGFGSYNDDMTRMLQDLQRRLEASARVPPPPRFPSFEISTSTSDDDNDEGGTSVFIGGTGFGNFFSSLGGGINPKDLKNKTTVRTEVIDGHRVTVKESTYVTDLHGIKSVVHLSEVDVGDSAESDERKPHKPSTPKTNVDSEEVDDRFGNPDADKPKEETTTPVNDDKSENDQTTESSENENKSSSSTTSTTAEKPSEDSDNDSITNNNTTDDTSEKPEVNPNEEVEQIETFEDTNDYYRYKSNDKLKAKEIIEVKPIESWSDNEIDSQLPTLSRPTRHASGGGVISLHDDTRVNQVLSQKQQSSGLYSIDPDAELLDEHNFYEVEGHRPNKNKVYFYQQNPNPSSNSVYENQYAEDVQVARRPNYQNQIRGQDDYQRRPPRYFESSQYNTRENYQRALPMTSATYQEQSLQTSHDYQRTLPVNYDREEVAKDYERGNFQSHIPVTFK